MTDTEKTEYVKIALALAGIATDNMTCEIIWRSHEGIQKMKGKFSIDDSSKIIALVEKKYNNKNKPSN